MVMVNGKSIGDLFEIVLFFGGKGDVFLFYVYKDIYEGIFVLDGKFELMFDGECYLLVLGDYVNILVGILYSYWMQSYRIRLVFYMMKGNVVYMYFVIGNLYDYVEYLLYVSEEVLNE